MVHNSRQPAFTSPENAAARSTLSQLQQTQSQTDAVRVMKAKQDQTDMEKARQVEFWTGRGAPPPPTHTEMQLFYLQRRHDIPCPLKPATERCSPCSCCRHPSLALTSTEKRRAAGNPIGLTGTVPNSQEWRRSATRESGRESGRENHGDECRTESKSVGVEYRDTAEGKDS